MVTVLIAHPSADLYGSDLQVIQSVRALEAISVNVLLVMPSEGPLASELPPSIVDITRFSVLRKSNLSPGGIWSLIRNSVGDLIRAIGLLRRHKPDVVYVNTITIPVWQLAARILRIPVVVHVHEAENNGSSVLRLALALPLLLSSSIVVNSRAAASVLTSALPRLQSNIRVVYNGVPDPGPASKAFIAGRIGYIGRLSPRKGVDVLLDAVGILRSSGFDVDVDLCGSTFPGYEDYASSLHKRAAMDDLSGHVHFHGYVRPVAPFLDRCQVLCVPSRAEPFGNVAVEGLLAGRPVVASAVQGLAEVIRDGQTGLLVESGSPAVLAEAIGSLLLDPARGAELGEAGRIDALSRFSVERYRDEIVSACMVLVRRSD